MKRLAYEYKVRLSFSDFIKEQQFQLRCIPQTDAHQTVVENNYSIIPSSAHTKFVDGFNNLVIAGSAMNIHKEFSFTVYGIMDVDYSKKQEETSHPIYRYATPLTRVDDSMSSLYPTSENFEDKMNEIMGNIRKEMSYQRGFTTVQTSAVEAYKLKKGVCQDYTHMMIGIARKLGYPARYVAGMFLGEGETHAWVEVYDGKYWHGYDPTNNRIVNDEYIVLNRGRDFTDCIIDKGVFMGCCNQTLEVHVSVKEVK